MSMYLYVKTHNKTGLKYLGKTEQSDPHKYHGSGKRWCNHLKKHGYDYTTEIILETNCKQELKEKGIFYSNLWNVTKSKEWANIVPEQGDGGNTSMSPLWKEAIKARDTSGVKNSMYGRSAVSEQNLRWYTNGTENIYVSENTQPEGFFRGRSNLKGRKQSQEIKEKISKKLKGHKNTIGRKVISPEGRVFNSIKDAASFVNLTASQFRHRCVKKGNWTIL